MSWGAWGAVLVAVDGLEWNPHRLVTALGFLFSASSAAKALQVRGCGPLGEEGKLPKLRATLLGITP